jgi:hypothetical protein
MEVSYADDALINISDDGMTNNLWQLAYDDIARMESLGVNSDQERNLLFYLEHFIDDLLEEFGYNINNKDEILLNTFKLLRNKKEVDLIAIRAAVLQSLRGLGKKVAYPNNIGVREDNAKPQRNIDEWILVLSQIYNAVNKGESRESASERLMEGWDPMEKRDFAAWSRYYERNDHEKYQLKRTAAGTPPFQMPELFKTPTTNEEQKFMRGRPGRPVKTKKTLEEMKQSLISRLDSAGRLLREFAQVWPSDVWNRLSQELSDLKREIIPLKTAATATDRIIRTANMWEREGFIEGANILRKVAQPPDVTTEIEKALTGREYESESEKPVVSDTGEVPDVKDLFGGEGSEEMPPGAEMPPAGTEEELPPPEEMPSEKPSEKPSEETPKEVINDENPFKGKDVNVQNVLDVLEPLLQKLSEREFVRAISKADMMLDSMNIASHFPELGEAQAKALELNLYVGARLEKVINKLKGGLKDEFKGDKKKIEAPEIEMGELGGEKIPEKEMFEVTEEGSEPTPTEKPVIPPVAKEEV